MLLGGKIIVYSPLKSESLPIATTFNLLGLSRCFPFVGTHPIFVDKVRIFQIIALN
jgi:hypothetical protein